MPHSPKWPLAGLPLDHVVLYLHHGVVLISLNELQVSEADSLDRRGSEYFKPELLQIIVPRVTRHFAVKGQRVDVLQYPATICGIDDTLELIAVKCRRRTHGGGKDQPIAMSL